MAKHNLGMVTAYAYAVAGGYTGTEAEFEALLGNIATDLEEIENLTVTATTLPEGSSATASYSDGVLTLGIPKGDTGATGAGATATAGTTTTGLPGTNASVVNSGTTKDAVFDFTIPRGDTGNGIESITLTSTAGAVHTYTITFSDGDTTTFDVTDGEVTTAALTAILADYAKTDGAYESMTVGNAEQLISSVYVTDEEPYQFRTSGGSADIGDREFDTLVGGSVAWNQLVQNGDFSTESNWSASNATKSISSGICTFTATAQNGNICTSNPSRIFPSTVNNHKYFALAEVKLTTGTTDVVLRLNGGYKEVKTAVNTNWQTLATVYSLANSDNGYVQIMDKRTSGFDAIQVDNVMVIDLTQMFGSTIADYIYSLETANAGAGVAFFRKYFPKPYYPYDAGTIKSVEGVSAHKTVGFNAWDEETRNGYYNLTTGAFTPSSSYICNKNMIGVVPNTTYCITAPSGINHPVFFYDYDGNFISRSGTNFAGVQTFTTPSNCYKLAFFMDTPYGTTYKNDICINLSWDGERNGEYEPYVEHSYPLDDSLTLRGIPKIANGKLYYDGDTYESDGTVTRKYGIVDLGTLTWLHTTNRSYINFNDIKLPTSTSVLGNAIAQKYTQIPANGSIVDGTFAILENGGNHRLYFYYDGVNEPSGYLIYEKDTPTTETADTFVNPQIVDDFGTEEYVTTSIVPVGHSTNYTNNLKAKLEMSPESPSGDGLYLVQQSSGQNAYVQYISPVPSNPSTDGTYVLKATVSGGTATLTWVAE